MQRGKAAGPQVRDHALPHLNVSRSSTNTTASVVAATVAERGQLYIRLISPKQSPAALVLTLNMTFLRFSKTCWMHTNTGPLRVHLAADLQAGASAAAAGSDSVEAGSPHLKLAALDDVQLAGRDAHVPL